ncbi:ABC export system, membrane fusion protein [Janthinobacterium sp. Marseille]|nr:efflux RND transporter periplasmic adaptor subunit [Janthinobacterium sp. Marseille]ABR90488.1 ABC export system, membrane fusion protein [Janthinobacterium sp. Marseille]
MNTRKSFTRKQKTIGLVVLVAALAAIGLWSGNRSDAQFEVAPVARGNIEATVTAIGTLQPMSSVEVGAQVSGQVLKLHVQPGDVVKKGQLLAEIDASVLQATVDAGRAQQNELQAQLAEQRAQHRLSSQQHDRQQQMHKDESTRLEDVQTAEANLAAAVARIAQTQARIVQTQSSLKADEARLGYTRIYAPMGGTVIGIDAKEGQTLNATYQTPTLMRIADLSAMTVWTTVSEADIRRVKAGQAAYFTTLAGDRRRWTGEVRQVLPAPPVAAATQSSPNQTPVSKVVQYTVLFDVDNKDAELLPQMTAQVSFITASARDVLVAPLSALQPVEQKPQVYTARILGSDDKPQAREVRAGVNDRLAVQVLEGLKEGEKLITGEVVAQSKTRRFQW